MEDITFGKLSTWAAKTYVPLNVSVPAGGAVSAFGRTTWGAPCPVKVITPWNAGAPVVVLPAFLATVKLSVVVRDASRGVVARGATTVRPSVAFLQSKYHTMRSYAELQWYRGLDARPCGKSTYVGMKWLLTDVRDWDTVHGVVEFWGPSAEALERPYKLSVVDAFSRAVPISAPVITGDELERQDDGSYLRIIRYSLTVPHTLRSFTIWARHASHEVGDGFLTLDATKLAWERGYGLGWRYKRPDGATYFEWYPRVSRTSALELEIQRREPISGAPRVSLVTDLTEDDPGALLETLDSLEAQTHGAWELVGFGGASPDDRWRWEGPRWRESGEGLDEGAGSARPPKDANEALAVAAGEFVGTVAQGDVLEPDCLHRLLKALVEPATGGGERPRAMAYGDQDLMRLEENGRTIFFNAVFKPEFDRELLRSTGYTGMPALVIRSCLKRPLPKGLADVRLLALELALRAEESGSELVHVPLVLYHEKAEMTEAPARLGFAVGTPEASRALEAVEASLEHEGVRAAVREDALVGSGLRVEYEAAAQGDEPLVSIVIPNKDSAAMLERCIASIVALSTYRNFEIVIVENNSTEPRTFAAYERLELSDRIRHVVYEGPFNFSAICNAGARQAEGAYLLFLNNDTEVIEPRWLELMLGPLRQGSAGVSGARLLYKDGLLQHGGVAIDSSGAIHVESYAMPGYDAYLNLTNGHAHTMSAVTGACLLVGKGLFERLGGFDESFPIAYNDVDLCFRAREAGASVVIDPQALLWHFESFSRGVDFDDPAKYERLLCDGGRLARRWARYYAIGDPYYDHRYAYHNNYYMLCWSPED